MNPHAAELILKHAASLLDESEFIDDPGGRGEVVFAAGEIVKSVVDSMERRRQREPESDAPSAALPTCPKCGAMPCSAQDPREGFVRNVLILGCPRCGEYVVFRRELRTKGA